MIALEVSNIPSEKSRSKVGVFAQQYLCGLLSPMTCALARAPMGRTLTYLTGEIELYEKNNY